MSRTHSACRVETLLDACIEDFRKLEGVEMVSTRHAGVRALRCFLNFAAADAGRANLNALGRAFDDGVHALQVDVPAPLCHIVRVTHPVPKQRPSSANFTYFRHNRCSSSGSSSLSAFRIWCGALSG